MEELKRSQEIISLGKKIIQEFSREDRRNTTLGWMAHYIAELIVSAENEMKPDRKIKLQKEASEIILAIWSKRNDFPRGSRPLSGLSSAVEVINSLKADEPMSYWERIRGYEEDSEWGKFAKTLFRSSQTIFDLTLLASIGHEILLKEKEWTEFPNLLSEEEKQILDYLDRMLERDESPIKVVVADSAADDEEQKPQKIEEVFDKIERLLQEQIKKFEALKSNVLAAKQTLKDDKDDESDPEYNDYLD